MAIGVHIPVVISGVVGLFLEKEGGVTLALGALGSMVALIAAYAGLNVKQKGIERNV
jgi:hypothetical protein